MPAEVAQQEDTFSKNLSKRARLSRALSISSRYKDDARHEAITKANDESRAGRFYKADMSDREMKKLGRVEKARDRATFMLGQAQDLASLVVKQSAQEDYLQQIKEKTQDRHMLSAVMAAREVVNQHQGEESGVLEELAKAAAVEALSRSFHGTENRQIMEDAGSAQEITRQKGLEELRKYLESRYGNWKDKLLKSAAIQGSGARLQIPDQAAKEGEQEDAPADEEDVALVENADAEGDVNHIPAQAKPAIDVDTNASMKLVGSLLSPVASGISEGTSMVGKLFTHTNTDVDIGSFAENAKDIGGWQKGVGGGLGAVGLASGVLNLVVNSNNLDRHLKNKDGGELIAEDALNLTKAASTIATGASKMAGTIAPELASKVLPGIPILGAIGGTASAIKGATQFTGGAMRKKSIHDQMGEAGKLEDEYANGEEDESIADLMATLKQSNHAASSDMIEGGVGAALGAAQAASGFIPGVGSAVSLVSSVGSTVNEKAVDRKRKLNIREYVDNIVPWRKLVAEIHGKSDQQDEAITSGMKSLSLRDIKHTILNFAGAQSGKRLEGGLVGLRSTAHALRDSAGSNFKGKEIMQKALRIGDDAGLETIGRKLGMTRRHASNMDVAINRRIEDAKLANASGGSTMKLRKGRLGRFLGRVGKTISSK